MTKSKSDSRTKIIVAIIGAIALIVAAIIRKDVIVLNVPGDNEKRMTSTTDAQVATTQFTPSILESTLSLQLTTTKIYEDVRATITSEATLLAPGRLILEPTSTVKSTPTNPLISTSTPTLSPMPSPTFPITPTPQIVFPFIDNFDRQKSPLWRELSGTWMIEEGRYTGLAGTGVGWFWTKLDIPDMMDYRLSVNINIPSYGSANQGSFAIVVRASSSPSEYLGYVFGFPRSTASWSIIKENDRSSITKTFENIPAEADLEIEVIGDNFVARVNGFEKENITLSGYDHGWIGLGLKCSYKCPSFDKFHLEPIE